VRLSWRGRRPWVVPSDVATAIAPGPGDRLLAWAADGQGRTVVAGRYRLHLVAPAADGGLEAALDRPWHLVDSGSWRGEDLALRVSWVDQQPDLRLVLPEPGLFPQTLRERVQASVVLTEVLDLDGRRSARVVVRRVLESGELVPQALLGAGVRLEDPGVRQEVAAGLARVREQVGLD
jgi:hypothetical protein